MTDYEIQDLEYKEELLKVLEGIKKEMARSNDTVDELNRAAEEGAGQIGVEFGDPE